MMRAAPAEHWGAFVFIAVATGVLYFNYAWFREQLCIVICPYGRLQSALIDDHSLVIGYDAKRGEPRGRRAQTSCNLLGYTTPGAAAPAVRALGGAVSGAAAVGVAQPGTAAGPDGAASVAATGDCVDCFRCVQVCPTGIDIRQGLQMECIGCTACIDACDDVMTRLRRPTGLIRYDSQKAFSGGRTSWLRPRTVLYGVLLVVGALVAGWALSTVRPANFGISRMTGAPYFVDETTVRNQFLVRILNKRSEPARFVVHVTDLPKGVRQTGFEQTVSVGALEESVQPLILQQDRRAYVGPFEFDVRVEGIDTGFHLDRDVEFLGPEARLLREEEEKK
jgi:polyferredoxin